MRSKESAVSKDKGKCHKDNAERKKPDQRMQDWDSQAHSHAVVSLPTYHHKKNSCLGICPDRNTTNMTESPMHESPVIPRETWHAFTVRKLIYSVIPANLSPFHCVAAWVESHEQAWLQNTLTPQFLRMCPRTHGPASLSFYLLWLGIKVSQDF